MKRFAIIIAIMATVCFMSHISAARAETITGPFINVNGNSVFQCDGFEADAVGELPSVTSSGAWNATEMGDDVRVRVVDGAPGAASGTNFLDMYDPRIGVAGHPFAEAVMSTSAVPGDQVEAMFGLYVDSAGNSSTGSLFCNFMTTAGTTSSYAYGANFLKIGFQDGDFVGEAGIDTTGIDAGDLILGWYDGSQYHNVTSGGANMYMSPDAWHTVEMSADLAVGWTITVDGVTSDVAGWRSGHSGGNVIESLMIGGASANPTQFYLDGAVPEPSAMVMLAGFVISIAAISRRKRQ